MWIFVESLGSVDGESQARGNRLRAHSDRLFGAPILRGVLWHQGLLLSQHSSWYEKAHITFSDALGSVRTLLWGEMIFQTSPFEAEYVKIPRHQLLLWQNALAWAA